MRIAIGLACLLALALGGGTSAQEKPTPAPSVELDAPYVPTPAFVVKAMLTLGGVGPGDIVYDLGSGDGRLPIAAVKDFGAAKGVGIDLDPVRVAEAKANAKKAGVVDRVTFHEGDMFEFDFSEATVMPLYLLPDMMIKLRPKILELKPGSRIVAHDYALGDWEADKVEAMDGRTLYFFVVPAKVNGTWEWRAGGRTYRADLGQTYQKVAGTLYIDGEKTPVEIPVLSGDSLKFEARLRGPNGTQPLAFEGKVAGDSMDATVVLAGRSSKVVAKRVQ
jgi:SAM-dependent methyltransferase